MLLVPHHSRIVLSTALAAGLVCLAASRPLAQTLVAVGEEWTYFKGTQEPPAEWTDVEFDDGSWERGPTGIGYGDADDATVLADMQNGYSSVFLRRSFEVTDSSTVASLILTLNYDDGFVAYINGSEVARSGLIGIPPPFDELAAGHEAGVPEDFAVPNPQSAVVNGTNVLAIQCHNQTLGSTDLSMIPTLSANPQLCPFGFTCAFDASLNTVTLNWTNRETYQSIAILRNGETLSADIGGNQQTFPDADPPSGVVTYGLAATDTRGQACAPIECTVTVFSPDDLLAGEGTTWRFFRGTVAPPAEWIAEDFDDSSWESGPTGIGYGDADDMTELLDMQNGYLTVFCRLSFEIDDLRAIEKLVLTVRYDDGFVAYVNGQEVGREGMPLGDATDQTAATVAIEPIDGVPIEILPDVLTNGANVLAVSVHNAALNSSDLTFLPTLVRVRGGPVLEMFRRGDADASGGVPNLTDAVRMLRHLFQGGEAPSCADAADVDDTGALSISDPIALLNALFRGGVRPPTPGFDCGVDPTADALAPCSTADC